MGFGASQADCATLFRLERRLSFGRMSDDGIEVPYNQDLKQLEALLAGVRRPGDFFVQGAFELPLPRVEVEGVGVLAGVRHWRFL